MCIKKPSQNHDANKLGRITAYTYDALNRVISTAYADDSQSHQAYDAAGRMISNTDARGNATTYEYDAANRTQSTITDTRGTRTWNYDSMNRLSRETQPDGSTLDYQYDAAGNKSQLITTVASGQSQTTTYGYDENANRSGISYPNDTSQTWRYDSRNRLISTAVYNSTHRGISSVSRCCRLCITASTWICSSDLIS